VLLLCERKCFDISSLPSLTQFWIAAVAAAAGGGCEYDNYVVLNE
jgi:hypothetical protein